MVDRLQFLIGVPARERIAFGAILKAARRGRSSSSAGLGISPHADAMFHISRSSSDRIVHIDAGPRNAGAINAMNTRTIHPKAERRKGRFPGAGPY
jgi:hypothetical protein